MKPPQFYTLIAVSIIALVLTFTLITLGQGNQKMQDKLQAQQEDINRGSMSQQIGTNLLREIAVDSQKDPKLKDLLTRNGYTVSVNSSPSPSPAETSGAGASSASPTP